MKKFIILLFSSLLFLSSPMDAKAELINVKNIHKRKEDFLMKSSFYIRKIQVLKALSDICSQISELCRFSIKFAEKRDDFFGICGCFEVKVEHEFEVSSCDGA